MADPRKQPVWISPIILLLAGILIWRGGQGISNGRALDASSKLAVGHVTALGSKGGFTYDFEVGNATFSGHGWDKTAVGATVAVSYLPGDPSVSRITGSNETPGSFAMIAFGSALAVFGTLVALGVISPKNRPV